MCLQDVHSRCAVCVVVVGVKISQEKLREFMLSHASVCSTESNICYLLDDGAFVMLSSDEENALQVTAVMTDCCVVVVTLVVTLVTSSILACNTVNS